MRSMATRRCIETSSWVSKPICSKDVQLHICGVPFTLGRELLAARSAKLAELLKLNPQEDLSHLLEGIPADPKTFELVGRFCHGYEVNITAENVVRVCCLASFLEMTEDHSTNNLLKTALTFFEQKVIPSWNKSVRALRTTESILQPASKLGLVDACADSIITKALTNPHFLGEPVKILTSDDDGDDNENTHRPNARRRLFVLDWKYEDLTTLSLQLYEPIIRSMIQRQVSSEYVAASICRYAKTQVFSTAAIGDDMPISKKHDQREAIEAVQRLLPHERGLIPCTLLFEMLRLAIALEASLECRNGFEIRIGKQLDQATVKDLLIPSHGYAKELQYDTECVKRILKIFYCNYTSPDVSGLITVAELVEDFLAEVASDIDLKMSTFISVAEMSIAASAGTQRRSDGIYRAIDIYLDKHRYLTESEKEVLCRVLDCNKMTSEACEHAAQNDRLPLRVVVQVLFVGQLQIRDTIAKEVQGSDDGMRKSVEQLEEQTARIGSSEDEVLTEIEKMGSKVMELEKDCYMMRTGIRINCCSRAKKEKVGMWKEMKRKFGCITSMHDCNCHVKKKKKKVHPR